jgi:hypothetical protein
MVHKSKNEGDMMSMMLGMSMMFYAQWYKEDISPNLTIPQKQKLLKKISDLSLERDITSVGVDIDKKDFPELVPFMHTEKLSGMQLYAVMTELFHELHPKNPLKRPYPTLPSKE